MKREERDKVNMIKRHYFGDHQRPDPSTMEGYLLTLLRAQDREIKKLRKAQGKEAEKSRRVFETCRCRERRLQNELIAYREAEGTGTLIRVPETGIGDLSDGCHTFNELYHHRAVLFSMICNAHPNIAWKSMSHDNGSMFPGMFIVGINTPDGQATYHYHVDPYWEMYHVPVLERAPKWDGHTPAQAIERIAAYSEAVVKAHAVINEFILESDADSYAGTGAPFDEPIKAEL